MKEDCIDWKLCVYFNKNKSSTYHNRVTVLYLYYFVYHSTLPQKSIVSQRYLYTPHYPVFF